MNSNKSKTFIYLLSFFIPVAVLALGYLQLGIYPFGPSTVLIYDMRAQLLALYGYLSNSGPGFDGLFHNMSGGLGGGFLGTAALYISPLDMIYSFVPVKYLPDAIYFMIMLRIGLSGLFFSVFLSKTEENKIKAAYIVLFSCCYALMSYNVMYALSPMWLDMVMYLPLLALFLEKIICGEYSIPFIILLSFCIFSDYYIAYMVIIAISMYFLFRLIESGNGFKDIFKRILLYSFHGLISALLSAVVIIPVALDFGRGKLSEKRDPENLVFIKNSFLDVISSFKSSSYTTLDGGSPPNIFCGTIVVILALIWFLAGKKVIKARLTGLMIVLVYFLSFMFGPVDRIWHGFRDPVGFSARYSFTFSFLMLCFAIRGYKYITLNSSKISASLIKFAGVICIFYTAVELYINGAYILSRLAVEARYANRSEYDRYSDIMTNLLSSVNYDEVGGYSRLCKNFRYTRFDGAMYGYDGIERFSSSYNLALDEFLSDIGLGSSYHTLSEYGMTPPVAGLLNVGYFISYYSDCSEYYDLLSSDHGVELYKNPNLVSLAVNVDESIVDDMCEFGDIPFENINLVFSDLVSDEYDSKIFKPQGFTVHELDSDSAHKFGAIGIQMFCFQPEKEGNYWFYTDYVYPDESRYKEAWKQGEFSEISAFADYYVNDNRIGVFRNDEFSYCNDIGYLNAENEYKLTLETSLSDLGNTYLYYFDFETYKTLSEKLKNRSYDIISIDSSGIVLQGQSKQDSYVLISLPYEKGYKVEVDGVKTDYVSYRGALMMIPVSEGSHEICIKYSAPGLNVGMCCSLFGLIMLIILPKITLKMNFGRKNAQKLI